MSNLLPIETKNSIKKEYNLRIAAAVLFFIAAILFISVAWLIPVYILSVNKYDVTQKELELIQAEALTIQPDNPKEVIDDINRRLEILDGGVFAEKYTYDIIVDTLSKKNKGIKINRIFYDKSGTQIKVLLKGEALKRENLSSFVSEIEKNELYSKVDLPISNFVKEINLDFSLTIYIEYDDPEKNDDKQ